MASNMKSHSKLCKVHHAQTADTETRDCFINQSFVILMSEHLVLLPPCQVLDPTHTQNNAESSVALG